MQISAAFCLEQERLQREKAENEPLENRKKIALNAAKAWAAEALVAEKRYGKQSPLEKADVAIAAEFAAEAETGEAN